MSDRLFSERHWRALGNGVCFKHPDYSIASLLWCVDMMGRASKQDELSEFGIYQASAADNEMLRIVNGVFDRMYAHCWIEGRRGSRRFVADGTAGQFSYRHQAGFYGDPMEAGGILEGIYSGNSAPIVVLSSDSPNILPKMKLFSPVTAEHLSRR